MRSSTVILPIAASHPRPHALAHARNMSIALVAALSLAVALIAVPERAAAGAPATVDLGKATPFAVLAGAGVGVTGSSRVTGDVGAYPRPAISDQLGADVHGTVHRGGPVAQAAQADLADAYAIVGGATPTSVGLGSSIDGDMLVAGTYALSGGSVRVRGHVVLDGEGDRDATWIFQVPSDLETSSGSTIELVNGAQACNVFWHVGGAATLGAASVFAGTILATTAVTAEAGVMLDGRLLSMTGRVLLGSNTIALPVCAAVSPVSAPVAQAAVAEAANASAPKPSAPPPLSVDASDGDGRPPYLPILAILTIILAVLLDDPRRGRRSAEGRR